MAEFPDNPLREHPGDLLRVWRQRRRLTQLELSCETGISTRHLSFLETGRAMPSRRMLLRLCEELDLTLRERNRLFLASGYAPIYPERPLNHPSLSLARSAMAAVLTGLEPNPALVIDRHCTLISSNRAVTPLLEGVAPWLLDPPVNVPRLSLHPEGLAPRIVNLPEWREHLVARLRRQANLSADPVLMALIEEVAKFPPDKEEQSTPTNTHAAVVPFRLAVGKGVFSFLSTTMLLRNF